MSLGLALLTKYSAIVVVPVVVGGYAWFNPQRFRSVWLGAGAVISAILLTPVVVYNAMLYRTRGHFDATLSAMLGLRHPDLWSDYHAYSRPGQWLQ